MSKENQKKEAAALIMARHVADASTPGAMGYDAALSELIKLGYDAKAADDLLVPTPEVRVHLPRVLALAFLMRADVLNMRGKQRAAHALEWFCGAAAAFDLAGATDKSKWTAKLCFLLSIRGYEEVVNLAFSKPATEQKDAA